MPLQTYESACPACGHTLDFPDSVTDGAEAQQRIQDLETQVKVLNSKAAAAVDKLADYEDEVRFLRASLSRAQQQPPSVPPPNGLTSPPVDATSAPPPSRLASLSALLPGRKRDGPSTTQAPPQHPTTPATATFPPSNTNTPPNLPSSGQGTSATSLEPNPHSTTVTLTSLQSTLETERTLRLRAESSLTQAQTELEELTAQLFGQANEMVAQERKARAKLEERVKVLELRDVEKRKRLERLEKALERIDRVRGMVG